MILGQSAATAAVLAIERQCPVQEVPYASLRERLLHDGQVLTLADRVARRPANEPAAHGFGLPTLADPVAQPTTR